MDGRSTRTPPRSSMYQASRQAITLTILVDHIDHIDRRLSQCESSMSKKKNLRSSDDCSAWARRGRRGVIRLHTMFTLYKCQPLSAVVLCHTLALPVDGRTSSPISLLVPFRLPRSQSACIMKLPRIVGARRGSLRIYQKDAPLIGAPSHHQLILPFLFSSFTSLYMSDPFHSPHAYITILASKPSVPNWTLITTGFLVRSTRNWMVGHLSKARDYHTRQTIVHHQTQ